MRFKNSFMRFMSVVLMAEAGEGGEGNAPVTAPSPAPAPARHGAEARPPRARA